MVQLLSLKHRYCSDLSWGSSCIHRQKPKWPREENMQDTMFEVSSSTASSHRPAQKGFLRRRLMN